MNAEIIMAGFGGQGIMTMGQLLTYAGMKEGFEVTWMPSYGPEQRGGTANCGVVISDRPVASPVVTKPTDAIVMNRPSLDKFAPKVQAGGNLFINSSLVEVEDSEIDNEQIEIFRIPTNEIAEELGNVRVANMPILAAFVAHTGYVEVDTLKASLADVFPPRHHDLLPLNEKAMDRGVESLQ